MAGTSPAMTNCYPRPRFTRVGSTWNSTQFATSLTYGDAISDEMLEIRKCLHDEGYESEIFVRFFDPRLAGLIKDYREYRRWSSPDNVVIFHFSIGSPVSKVFFRIPDKRIMIRASCCVMVLPPWSVWSFTKLIASTRTIASRSIPRFE